MPYASGTWTAATSTWNPAVALTQISVADWTTLLADISTGLSTAMLKDGSQTASAVVPFAAGLSVSGGSTLATYTLGSTSSTFTWDGAGGTSGAVTLTWQRVGNFVTLNIPGVSATSGTGSAAFVGNTALAAGARPSGTQDCVVMSIINNNAVVGPAGQVTVTSAGVVTILRDAAGTAFTNTATAGLNRSTTVTYYAG